MSNFAASFDTQLSPVAPFLFYLVIGIIIFIETGLLIGFFLPGDSLLFSAGLVAAARDDLNIVILISVIFLAAFIGRLESGRQPAARHDSLQQSTNLDATNFTVGHICQGGTPDRIFNFFSCSADELRAARRARAQRSVGATTHRTCNLSCCSAQSQAHSAAVCNGTGGTAVEHCTKTSDQNDFIFGR